MHRKFASALLAAILASSGVAVAQPGGPGPGHGQGGPAGGPGHGQASRPGPAGGPPGAPGHGHGHDAGPKRGPSGGPGRGPADPPPQHWSKGQRVPSPYRGPQFVVNDWHAHHLRQPPRGYHWISVGADYFLIGVTTGIVLEALLGGR